MHFATPGRRFTARYHEREAAVEDADPPFTRSVLLPLPDEADEKAGQRLTALAGHYLYRDLCTPLGRTADLARAGMSGPRWDARGQYFQTAGLFRLSWPRQALLRATAAIEPAPAGIQSS